MTLAVNSAAGFVSTVRVQHVSRTSTGDNQPTWRKISGKNNFGSTHVGILFGPGRHLKSIRQHKVLLAAESSNRAPTDSARLDSGSVANELSGNQFSAAEPVPLSSTVHNIQHDITNNYETISQVQEASNGLPNASEVKQEKMPSSAAESMPKRSPLTAREKLRAARVLSRYTESKPSKSELGSKVLDALRESDKGKKRSGLPEAPSNLLDDSKRGLPKQGLTFDFPGGADLFFIILSFVVISTIMFATTYIVWKVGAIHFNEY